MPSENSARGSAVRPPENNGTILSLERQPLAGGSDCSRSDSAQSRNRSSGSGLSWLIDEWPLVLAVGFAAFLRGFQLWVQIPIGDEWHALDAAWRRPLWEILTSLDVRYSTPMVLYEKLVMGTAGMSELSLYLPLFIAGVAIVWVFPLIVRNWAGKKTSDLFAWLLAISPMLILYSRFFRPYILTVFLGGACLYLSWRWRREHLVTYGVAYAICGALAVYLQIVSVVFVAAPFLFIAMEDLRLSGRRPRVAWQFVGVVGLFAALLSLLVGLPLAGNAEMITKKMGQQGVGLHTITRAASLFSGAVNLWVVGILVALACIGLGVLCRRHRVLAVFVLAASVFQCLAVIVVAPTSIGSSLVFARYMVLSLPFFLLCVASGSVFLMELLFRHDWGLVPSVVAGVVFIGGLLWSGPLPSVLYMPNNWISAVLQVEMMKEDPKSRIRHFFDRSETLKQGISPFYQFLNDQPRGSLKIVEVPWFFRLTLNRNPWLQQFHQQSCSVGISSCISGHTIGKGEFPCTPDYFRFNNLLFLDDPETLRKKSVDYLIVHRNLVTEVKAGEVKRPGLVRSLVARSPEIPELLENFRATIGPPCYEDQWVTVFGLNASSVELIQSSSYSR
ncbi:MAG: hypothetical protein DRJ61_01345 [Acidobacteria bacterium]|nr:MAG: hypothetical protein DRJ65_08395 [Acidobacteriota bacterium]RLE36190.1 MAG: hypothetical protein DRJ61_01345 [Acidobacteriota bacterium]